MGKRPRQLAAHGGRHLVPVQRRRPVDIYSTAPQRNRGLHEPALPRCHAAILDGRLPRYPRCQGRWRPCTGYDRGRIPGSQCVARVHAASGVQGRVHGLCASKVIGLANVTDLLAAHVSGLQYSRAFEEL